MALWFSVFIYLFIYFRIYDEAKRSKQSVSAGDQSNLLLDDQSLFDKLAALVDKSRPDPFDTDAYTVIIDYRTYHIYSNTLTLSAQQTKTIAIANISLNLLLPDVMNKRCRFTINPQFLISLNRFSDITKSIL